MGGNFEATLCGESRDTIAGWFAAAGWKGHKLGQGNWAVCRGRSELVVSLLPRHGQPIAVRGWLADVIAEGPEVCCLLDASRVGYTAKWFDGSGAEVGGQLSEVMVDFKT